MNPYRFGVSASDLPPDVLDALGEDVVDFRDVDFRAVDLRDTDFRAVDLPDADLRDADFGAADLRDKD